MILFIIQQEGIEVSLRVERLVAEELVEIAMNTVGAGFRNHVYHRPGVAAVFRVEGVGDDSKLFDRVRRGLNRRGVNEYVVAIASVHHVIVGATAASVN